MKYLSPTDPLYATPPPSSHNEPTPIPSSASQLPQPSQTLPYHKVPYLQETPSSSAIPTQIPTLQENQLAFHHVLMAEKYFKVQESILLQLQQMQLQIRNLEEQMMQFSSRSFQSPKNTSSVSVGTNTSFPSLQSILSTPHLIRYTIHYTTTSPHCHITIPPTTHAITPPSPHYTTAYISHTTILTALICERYGTRFAQQVSNNSAYTRATPSITLQPLHESSTLPLNTRKNHERPPHK